MPRYSRGMAIRPVHRIKHVIDSSATVAGGATFSQVLVLSVDAPVLANTTQCETGSKVNGLYLRVEVASNETEVVGAIPNCYLTIAKNPGGNLTLPIPNAVGANDNKRFVFHQEMLMFENSKGGNPRTLFNGVIAIPKGYRRNGPNDQISIQILSPVIDIALCLQCHYKEFR